MSLDEQHTALPKLYGAPAYARPPAATAGIERPFDPDELPIEAFQSDEDREVAVLIASGGVDPRKASPGPVDDGDGGRSRFSLRAIAGRFLGGT